MHKKDNALQGGVFNGVIIPMNLHYITKTCIFSTVTLFLVVRFLEVV